MEWTVAILLGVVIITGMSGNSLLDGVVAAAKLATAVEGNALLLLWLFVVGLLLVVHVGDGPVGVTDRHKRSDKSKWQLQTKKKKKPSKRRPKLLIRIALKKLKNIFNYLLGKGRKKNFR